MVSEPLTLQQVRLLIKQQTDYTFNELENRIHAANIRIDKLIKVNRLLVEELKKIKKNAD